MKRDALLQRIREAREQLDAVLAALDDAALAQPGFAGDWSAKDVMAHIVWHERETTAPLPSREDNLTDPGGLIILSRLRI